MPSRKRYCGEDGAVHDLADYIEWMDVDENGIPIIYPEEYNVLTNPEQTEWSDAIFDEVVDLYEMIIRSVESSGSPMLEKIDFSTFFMFVARNSYKTV